MSVFDKDFRSKLQADIKAGRVDPDELLPELMDWIEVKYYNLFQNLEAGERAVCPATRRGNAAYAHYQSQGKSDLAKILRKTNISYKNEHGTYSHLLFQTPTFDRSEMGREEANYFITNKGKGIKNLFARFKKIIKGRYSEVLVKESTVSGYPAVHILLYLETPLKAIYHRKSRSYRPYPRDTYTRSVLSKWNNMEDWNSVSPL